MVKFGGEKKVLNLNSLFKWCAGKNITSRVRPCGCQFAIQAFPHVCIRDGGSLSSGCSLKSPEHTVKTFFFLIFIYLAAFSLSWGARDLLLQHEGSRVL